MKRLFISLLAISVMSFGASSGFAATQVSVTGSVTLTGTPFVSVTPSTLSWSGITLGTTQWKTADTLLQVSYLLPAGGAIAVYTNNAQDRVGLVGATDNTTLPTAWRIMNSSSDFTTAELTIYEHVYSEAAANEDLNGDTDMTDWISKLTNQSTKPAFSPKNNQWPYACWLWMLDGPVTTSTSANDRSYMSIVNAAKGMQHAEGTWGTWGGSPDYVAIAANFSKGTPQTYNITLELSIINP